MRYQSRVEALYTVFYSFMRCSYEYVNPQIEICNDLLRIFKIEIINLNIRRSRR